NLAITRFESLSELVGRSLSGEKLMARLAGFFGAVALLLAAIGLYGILAYSVAQRTSEIGIRMALGARPATVLGMVLNESLLLVAIGLAMGIPATLAAGRLIQGQLFGLESHDAPTIIGAAATMLITTVAASLLPARRAAALDPIVALRNE